MNRTIIKEYVKNKKGKTSKKSGKIPGNLEGRGIYDGL